MICLMLVSHVADLKSLESRILFITMHSTKPIEKLMAIETTKRKQLSWVSIRMSAEIYCDRIFVSSVFQCFCRCMEFNANRPRATTPLPCHFIKFFRWKIKKTVLDLTIEHHIEYYKVTVSINRKNHILADANTWIWRIIHQKAFGLTFTEKNPFTMLTILYVVDLSSCVEFYGFASVYAMM